MYLVFVSSLDNIVVEWMFVEIWLSDFGWKENWDEVNYLKWKINKNIIDNLVLLCIGMNVFLFRESC